MGLGLSVEAAIPGRGILRRRPGRDRLFSEVCDTIREYVADPLMARMIHVISQEHTLSIVLHPCAEPVEFLWNPSGVIQASAKTSTVGPGYHAFVIEVLRHLESTIGMKWNWHTEVADEAEFANTGNYPALQSEMATLWRSLARILLDQDSQGHETLMVNMPLGFPSPQINVFAVTPLGPISRECCESIQSGDEQALATACCRYFVWWNQGPDAAFWRNTGMMLLWCQVPWHVPDSEEEHDVCRLALDCLSRAGELNPDMELPRAERDELESLLAVPADEQCSLPSPLGIGYHRSAMLWHLTGSWSLPLPGYYHQTEEDDGTMLVFYFGNRTVRFTSFTVTRDSDVSSSPRDMLPSQESDQARGAEIIDLEKGHIQGWASIADETENGEDFWMLRGHAACANSLGILTICYFDLADKTWAIETFKSITHPQANP